MTPTPQPPDETDVLFYVLRRKRRQARLVLFFEQLWPALWPPLGLAGSFATLALLEIPALLEPWGRAALLVIFALAIAATLIRGLLRLRAPSLAAADRRLERASGLRHRPLEVLHDHPVLQGADGLWQAHITRIRGQIGRLRVGLPRPGLAAIDRRALRVLVLMALLASIGVAGEQAPGRLARAFTPGFAPPAVAEAMLLQAWITPPAFTGLAPVFLKPEGGAITVPAGAHLTINLSGGTARPDLRQGDQTIAFQTLGEASFQLDRDLAESGHVEVRRAGAVLAAWDLAVIANLAPEVRFPEPPGPAGAPRQPSLRLPWQVAHAYGVTGLQAELRLVDRPDLPPLVVTVPLPGGAPKQAKGARQQDLTPHPWAGLKATATLVAHDATGLTGTSAAEPVVVPERKFTNPVARALVAIRKGLTLKPDDRMTGAHEIVRLGDLPEVWNNDLAGYLNLRAIGYRLRRAQGVAAIEEIQARLWQLALHVEEGAPERTARALEQARQELCNLLEAEKRGETPDQAELKQKLKDLQDALQRHLEALAEQARRDPGSEQFNPERDRMETRTLERLTEEMKDAARDGRMDEAREKLAELERLLDQLEKGDNPRNRMTERQKQRAEKRQQGERQVSAVQDMVKREGGLLDHAQSRDRPGFDFRRPGFGARPPAGAMPDPEQQARERNGDLRLQQALRRALGELMQQHGDLTGKVPDNLGEADRAMREAGQALAQGFDGTAGAAEQRAIAALQKGGKEMAEQAQKMFGRGGEDGDDEDGDGDQMSDGEGDQPGDQPGEGPGDGTGKGPGKTPGRRGNQYGNNQNGRANGPWGGRPGMDRRDDKRDPLGRVMQNGNGGLDENGETEIPEEMEQARTRALQDELRRRGAERTRPKPELDYIDRLLRQF